jgi:hypothetical protein
VRSQPAMGRMVRDADDTAETVPPRPGCHREERGNEGSAVVFATLRGPKLPEGRRSDLHPVRLRLVDQTGVSFSEQSTLRCVRCSDGLQVLRYVLLSSLIVSLSGHCQSYANSPFYQPVSAIPSTAHVDGYEHGTIHANGVVIDLSESVAESSPEFDRIAGWSAAMDVDGGKGSQIFHYKTQYDHMSPVVAFGYDLEVQPVQGTDQIRCTFSSLTEPSGPSADWWHRNKDIAAVALPHDLTPVVIHSGDILAIETLPLGPGKIAVIHYLRLIRTDQASDPAP